jgi:hypothetical protein
MTTAVAEFQTKRLALAVEGVKRFPMPELPAGFTCDLSLDTSREWLADGRVFQLRLTFIRADGTAYNQEWRSQIGCHLDLPNLSMRIYDEFADAIAKLRRRAGVLV